MKHRPHGTMIILMLMVSFVLLISCSIPDDPDDFPPQCTIIYPNDGQSVSGTVAVLIGATDNEKLSMVNLFIDDNLVESIKSGPYSYQWDTNSLANASEHSIIAVAFDEEGNSTFSPKVTVTVGDATPVDTESPTVSIIYPALGATFNVGDQIPIVVDAYDNIGVNDVEFIIDGQSKATDSEAPYEYNWDTSGLTAGQTHTIFIKASDEAGNIGTQLANIVIN